VAVKDTGRRGKVVQFVIYARDPKRVAAFYRAVFGWESSFFLSSTEPGSTEVHVIEDLAADGTDLRARIETPPESEPRVSGFECTIAVQSVETVTAAVLANGGTIIGGMPFVSDIGARLRFADPEGNVVTAMQFVEGSGSTPSG
jgi:predicted enzyme related to lactoylglutathione lyase